MLGAWIGRALLKGHGQGDVYATEKPNMLDFLPDHKDVRIRVKRERLTFIKGKKR